MKEDDEQLEAEKPQVVGQMTWGEIQKFRNDIQGQLDIALDTRERLVRCNLESYAAIPLAVEQCNREILRLVETFAVATRCIEDAYERVAQEKRGKR